MTTTLYVIEFWNPRVNKYQPGWVGKTERWANIMMNKSYNRLHTRRLVKITTEILEQKKGSKR